jgi:hypothetical protein
MKRSFNDRITHCYDVCTIDFEKTRALLKKVDANGESVYDHLINVVRIHHWSSIHTCTIASTVCYLLYRCYRCYKLQKTNQKIHWPLLKRFPYKYDK